MPLSRRQFLVGTLGIGAGARVSVLSPSVEPTGPPPRHGPPPGASTTPAAATPVPDGNGGRAAYRVSVASNGTYAMSCACGHFVSRNWPTAALAEARGAEHLKEHATGEPMRPTDVALGGRAPGAMR